MSSEYLYKDICDHPEDEVLRLLYADLLCDLGKSRGKFVQLYYQLLQIPKDDPGRPALENEYRKLEKSELEDWQEALKPFGVRGATLSRGLPETVSMTAAAFLDNAAELFREAPVTGLQILEVSSEQVVILAACPHLARLKSLELSGNWIGPDGATALAASLHLAGLTSLDLSVNRIGDAGAAALANSPHLSQRCRIPPL